MFVSQSHLPQRLRPEAYASADAHALEVARLFQHGWHLVGTTCELQEEGSYLTTSVLGHPVICWNSGGQIRAFINVCAHRFSELTSHPCGTAQVLECQYHGWQYGADGRACKIPDAASFKPLNRDQYRLAALRSETCGALVFVSVSETAPPLVSWLGENGYHRGLEFFEGDRMQTLKLDLPIEGNWKLTVENALESYHVGTVHAKTFGGAPPDESCTHLLFDNGTTFSTVEPPPPSIAVFFERLLHRLIGVHRGEQFEHSIYYPNVMIGRTSIYSWVMTSTPVTATTSRLRFFMFGRPSPRRNPLSRAALAILNRGAARYARRIIGEDAAIIPAVQKGMASPITPSEGLISVREERVFHFQDFLATRCHGLS